jgi:peptidoglycan/LPS O-acetylase OafA/YrhL
MDQTRKLSGVFTNFIYEKYKNVVDRINNALGISKQDNSILVLDGLRAIACLSVLFFHFRWLSSLYISKFPTEGPGAFVTAFFLFGNSGVILFFLLSGFLLFIPFAKALLVEDCKWPSLHRFYLKRVFRIIPAYYIALILLILFFHPAFLSLLQWRAVLKLLTFRMNYELAQQINGVFWTLAIEFQFYLLLPLIAWVMSLVVRRGSVHWRLAKLILCLLAMICWGLLTRYWALYIVDTTRLDWLLNHSVGVTLRLLLYGDPGHPESGKYFEVFGLGMLVCAFYVYSRNQNVRWTRVFQLISLFFGLLGLSSLAFLSLWNLYFLNLGAGPTLQYIFASYQNLLLNIWPIWRPFLIGLACALCMFALLHGPTWLKHPFEWIPLRWLGAISYSLYIWHMPLAFLFLGYTFPLLNGRRHVFQYMISLLWVLVVIIPFSVMFYRYVERPGIRLGASILRKIEKRKKTTGVVSVKNNIVVNDGNSIEKQKKDLIKV